MPRIKAPKSIIASRAKWEANRQKPSTWNPSRRREDMRRMAEERPITEEVELRDSKMVILDSTRRVIKKRYLADYIFVKHLAAHLAKIKFAHVVFVQVKTILPRAKMGGKGWAQRYFRRPSISALNDYLSGKGFLVKNLSPEDRNYCSNLLQSNPKINRGLVKNSHEELKKAFYEWEQPLKEMKEMGIVDGYDFAGGVNFIIFGLTNDGKLKVGLIDA